MHLNYIILAHKAPEQVGRLVRRLQQPAARFVIHVDKKADFAAFQRALAGLERVWLLENRVECAWSDFSIVEATNRCIDAVLGAGFAGPLILLSGQHYPMRSNGEILGFFKKRPGLNFIEVEAITPEGKGFFAGHDSRLVMYRFNLTSARHDFLLLPPLFSREFMRGGGGWRLIKGFFRSAGNRRLMLSGAFWREIAVIKKKRVQPIPMRQYGGQQWWALDYGTAGKLRAFIIRHPEFDAFHRHTQVPDELYYQSLLMHLAKEDADIRVAPPITYANWDREDARPAVFTSSPGDKAELGACEEGCLFARKFDMQRDAAILDWLDARNGGDAVGKQALSGMGSGGVES